MKDVTLADQVEAVNALPEAVARLNADVESRAAQPAAGDQVDAENHPPALRATSRQREAIPMPDLDKVCMIGWSYGGFLSALAVLDAPNVFKAACAGAPPTDWTLYDTHYTERYLGLDPDVYDRKRHRAGRTERAPALRHPRFRRRQRHHRPQPAPLASPDGGGSPAHLPAVDGHHPYDQ